MLRFRRPGFDSRLGQRRNFFSLRDHVQTGSPPPPHPPGRGGRGSFSLELKRPGSEVDTSSASSAEVKNAWSYTSTSPVRIHGVVLNQAMGASLWHLVKYRETLPLRFTLKLFDITSEFHVVIVNF
jgi:hypothetical protein